MTGSRPRVLANAVSARLGGGVTFALEQLSALARRPDIDLTVVAVEPTATRLRELAPNARVLTIPRRPLALRLVWEQSILAWRARRFDVVYGVGNFALIAARTPQVVAFNNPNHFGATAAQVNRRFGSPWHRFRILCERWLARASLWRARAAIAVSESFRATILEDFPAAGPQVVLGATPSTDQQEISRDRPGRLPGKYVLAVANDYPHKDRAGLVRAFSQARDLPPLVLVGAARSRDEETGSALRAGRSDNVILWGHEQDPAMIDLLYRNAEVVVAHSHLESFGLTPLEALSRGARVVASDLPVHRELCGDAPEYYDPDDPAELAAAVRKAMHSVSPAPLRQSRTWDDNAAELASILHSVVR